jgi:hypothetical protein
VNAARHQPPLSARRPAPPEPRPSTYVSFDVVVTRKQGLIVLYGEVNPDRAHRSTGYDFER